MRKQVIAVIGAAAMSMMMAMSAFAGSWQQNGTQWKYQNDNGGFATGWQWIDGKCYFFDSNGVMAANTTTSDGYTVDASGAWVVNGVVQTQGGAAAADSTSNPLDLSHLKQWIVQEPAQNPAVWSGNVDTRVVPQWINSDQYLMNHPELTNGTDEGTYSLQKAIAEKNPGYVFAPTSDYGVNEMALAELAGFPRVGNAEYYSLKGSRIDALKTSITEFLNSFPNWKTASDFEKAVRICEWINEKTVYEDGQPDDPYAYGALVNGKANCSGLTNAVEVLSWAIDLPIASYSPAGRAHVLPMFYLNGVWLAKEMTYDATSFYVPEDMFARNELNNGNYFNAIATYCEGTGYVAPSSVQVRAAFPGLTNTASDGSVEVRFH